MTEEQRYIVWFDYRTHALFDTYEKAWKASEAYFADTGKHALVETITTDRTNNDD